MRTIETTLFKFSELSDEAKNAAIERCRDWNTDDSFWYESVIDDSKAAAKILGIDADNIYFSGFWNQGDGAQFTGNYSYKKNAHKAIRKEWPQDETLHEIADKLLDVQKRHFYGLSAEVSSYDRYSHEYATRINVFDRDEFTVSDETKEEVSDALRDFMRWIYRRLEQEYELLTSDEAIADSLEANEVEFTENGNLH